MAASAASAASAGDDVPRLTLDALTYRSAKRARDLFMADHSKILGEFAEARATKVACKTHDEYEGLDVAVGGEAHSHAAGSAARGPAPMLALTMGGAAGGVSSGGASGGAGGKSLGAGSSQQLALVSTAKSSGAGGAARGSTGAGAAASAMGGQIVTVSESSGAKGAGALALRAPSRPKPDWHPHWKLARVISGHQGWVRCVAVDPTNEWFATGSADRTIKIWDLASGTLKLSLTGHISTIRGLAVSDRHPYLFSCSEDKSVKCWDLEQNKVIRHYHGHLSAVYAMAMHPTLDVLFTSGRDATVRVWDVRTKAQVHCLKGHTNTVGSLLASKVDPQVISGSHDSTIRLWDLAAGRCVTTLTNHKKSVRALASHPKEFTFASGSPDNIKQWYLPDGKFIQNCSGHNAIVNCLTVNTDGVMVSGADNGTLCFWDYKTGTKYQQFESMPQPGSLDSEAGVFALAFDRSYSRLLSVESDKTIKVYKEDPASTPDTHPVEWKPTILRNDRF